MLGVKVSQKVKYALDCAQTAQDQGESWGRALEIFEGMVEDD